MKSLKLWEFQNFFNENKFSIIRYNTSDQVDDAESLVKCRLNFTGIRVLDGIDSLFLIDHKTGNMMSISAVENIEVSSISEKHVCEISITYNTYNKKQKRKVVKLCAE